jgi:hypothetical protein
LPEWRRPSNQAKQLLAKREHLSRRAVHPDDGEDDAMRHRMVMAAALLLATVPGGCAVYPQYGTDYGRGYQATYAGSYGYRYRPYYSPDYNSTFGTYSNGGGASG